jgi:hypothetical protein
MVLQEAPGLWPVTAHKEDLGRRIEDFGGDASKHRELAFQLRLGDIGWHRGAIP